MPKDTTMHNFIRTFTIFSAQYLNTAILFVLAYNSFVFSESTKAENDKDDWLVGPFDEFNFRWYMIVGSPIALAIIIQILTPHVGLFVKFFCVSMLRWYDRGFTSNMRSTKQAVQSDYENLYTGPKFILQIRYAQMLSVMFVAMTFGSGLPILYLAAFLHFFFAYWTDKFLLLRYYRLTSGYTKFLSRNAISVMPLAVVLHILFGLVIFSNPQILQSEINPSYFGNDTKYYNTSRLGQRHVVIFLWASIAILVLTVLERTLTRIASALSACCRGLFLMCTIKIDKSAASDEMVLSDDLYKEISFAQLYEEYCRLKVERQKIKLQKSKGAFTDLDLKRYVEKYIASIERNE